MSFSLKPYYRNLTAVVLSFFTLSVSAQSLCDKLHSLKNKYYGFSPNGMTSAQIEVKSADLDKFWDLAKTDKPAAAECIRDMIMTENNDPYFCFDAATLLLSIDDKGRYINAVAEGVRKCRLKDLQLETYLKVVHFLGKKGIDISQFTERLMSEPNATVFLTQHVITLSAADASLFLYNEMGTQKAEESLLEILKNGNPTGRANAAIVLSQLSTPKGDSVLKVLMTNKQLPDSITIAIQKEWESVKTEFEKCNKGSMPREEVISRLKAYPGDIGSGDVEIAGNEELICSASKSLTSADAEVVRAARDRSTPGLSDEALYDYIVLSEILIYVRGK